MKQKQYKDIIAPTQGLNHFKVKELLNSMKSISFFIFFSFASIPVLFFTSCDKGASGEQSAPAPSSSQLSAPDFINQFCSNPGVSGKTQSKVSRFKAYSKIDLSNLTDTHVDTINGVPHYSLNITVNNTCLLNSQAGFTYDNFRNRITTSMRIQSFLYHHPIRGDLDALANQLLQDDCVLRASPNQKMEFQSHTESNFTWPAFNDDYVKQQKHLESIDVTGGFSHIYNPTLGMNVLLNNGSEVIIAVVDTGIDTSHPDLLDNYWSFTVTNSNKTIDGPFYGVDAVSLDRLVQSYTDYNPYDEDGHGTHVAGLIGATANNDRGVVGVIPYRSKIMGIKVYRYNSSTGQNNPYKTAVLNGARWARDKGAKVINISMGTLPIYNTAFDPDWEILFDELLSDGVSVVLATGNGTGSDPATEINNKTFAILPAIYGYSYKGVINVGATQAENKLRASFSHYSTKYVEMSAPGTQNNNGHLAPGLMSTAPTYNVLRFGTTTGYAYASGTSQSAPQVAGAVGQVYAFVKDKTGSWPSPCVAEAIIQYSADKVDGLKKDFKDGNHLNLHRLGEVLQELY